MATKELSNEFMQKIVNEEAWKELSGDFNWSETLLEKFQDMVDWNEISENSQSSNMAKNTGDSISTQPNRNHLRNV